MTRAEILELVERRQAATDRLDVEALTDLYAPDSTVESLMAGTVRGRAAIRGVGEAFRRAFPDVAFRTDETLIDGNRVAQFYTVTGTDTGGFMGLPPTGKPFRLPMVFLYTVENGLITHERRIYDFTGLLVQIGVLKAKPA
jgi:steroid delta-isomerase-like uncharacterized protein